MPPRSLPTAGGPSDGGPGDGASGDQGYASSLASRVRSRVVSEITGAVHTATDIVGDAAKALVTPTGLAGAAVEALWLGTHLAIYPLGLVGARARDVSHGYRIEHLGPVQRGLAIS
ncbi:MAG TPA: hypothetical protein VFT68_02325, partial [Lapillicoccus sp.]|nr:hypothetical protein [Lapillicoccus sp.]